MCDYVCSFLNSVHSLLVCFVIFFFFYCEFNYLGTFFLGSPKTGLKSFEDASHLIPKGTGGKGKLGTSLNGLRIFDHPGKVQLGCKFMYCNNSQGDTPLAVLSTKF